MNEQQLIGKAQHHDPEAWQDLIHLHRPAVYRHCLSLVHEEATAEDLTQETFIHAFQHLDSFRREARLATWLWRIAHNLSLNYLKKQEKLYSFREELFCKQEPERHEQDPEWQEKIRQALQHLPEKQRRVFEMYLLQQLSQKEIAAALKIPLGTVRSRLHYARQALKQRLQHEM